MRPFCECIVKDVLPAIRAQVTKKLLVEHGLTQKEVAELMGITQPAVSQYYRNSRGKNAKFLKNLEFEASINRLTENILNNRGKEKVLESYCQICKVLRERGLV